MYIRVKISSGTEKLINLLQVEIISPEIVNNIPRLVIETKTTRSIVPGDLDSFSAAIETVFLTKKVVSYNPSNLPS